MFGKIELFKTKHIRIYLNPQFTKVISRGWLNIININDISTSYRFWCVPKFFSLKNLN